MKILDYGSIVTVKNITFEDGKYDMEGKHPGVILLPTNEEQEEAVCLYMTTDRSRARREKYKYTECKYGTFKKSFINISQLTTIKNNKGKRELSRLNDEEMLALLDRFYKYQINLGEKNPGFMKIKAKIEILMGLISENIKIGINGTLNITREQIDFLEQVGNTERGKRIFAFSLAESAEVPKGYIYSQYLTSNKNRVLFDNLLELSEQIKKVDLSKIDLNNPNNELRKIYMNKKLKNYLINTNELFSELAMALRFTNTDETSIRVLEEFNDLEKAKEELKARKLTERIERNEKKRMLVAEKRNKTKKANRRKELIKKYGEFEEFQPYDD